MNSEIVAYSDYKAFLRDSIAARPKGGWGVKSSLAQAMRCETAYVSQILNGASHLSLEQAQAVCRYFKLGKPETHYFLLLVQRARAGTPELREYFDEQLRLAAGKFFNL